MCVSDIKHQPGCLSEVLRQIAFSRCCLGSLTALGVDLRHLSTVRAFVPQRHRNTKVSQYQQLPAKSGSCTIINQVLSITGNEQRRAEQYKRNEILFRWHAIQARKMSEAMSTPKALFAGCRLSEKRKKLCFGFVHSGRSGRQQPETYLFPPRTEAGG